MESVEEQKHEHTDTEPAIVISIPSVEGTGSATLYNITVQVADAKWQIKRKYSDFSLFNDKVVAVLPDKEKEGIYFPIESFLSFSPTAEHRREQIENYLKVICTIPSIYQNWEFSYLIGGLEGRLQKYRTNKATNGKIIFPLPDREFDPTESAVPWKIFTMEGFDVVFATETAQKPAADETLLNPGGIIWLAQMGTSEEAKSFYREMFDSEQYSNPIRWSDINPAEYDVLHLTGGHAPGMKQYLESQVLKDKIVQFTKLGRTVSSICHGSLLLARSIDPSTGNSVVYHKKLTSLPHWMEDVAWNVTRLTLDRHYRTYEQYCEDEIRTFLALSDQFQIGPRSLTAGTAYHSDGAFVIEDDGVISARWPGDAYRLARTVIDRLWKK